MGTLDMFGHIQQKQAKKIAGNSDVYLQTKHGLAPSIFSGDITLLRILECDWSWTFCEIIKEQDFSHT